ncbi:MAG: protein kinase [Alphaproteobacteria bacterium]|nr:protein kinase [Alphaproteobacteria bacterium]
MATHASDASLRRELPYPVAAAWHHVALSVSEAERLQRAIACLDSIPRLLVALLLPDYLRGAPVPAVESRLDALKRPSLGHWVGLARELARAVGSRETPAPFVPDATTWLFGPDGRPSAPAATLDLLVARRNTLAHGPTLASQHQIASQADSFVAELRKVLESLKWLGRYRLFRVLDQRPTRRRTAIGSVQQGRVQLFAGQEELTEPVEAEWDALLIPDALYLLGPDETGFLEVSPLIRVAPHPTTHTEHLFLAAEVHDLQRVVLEHGATGARVTRLVETDHGEVPFDEWLAHRERGAPFLANSVATGGLAAPRVASGPGIGDLLGGRYRILEAVGRGESRQVYRATDERTGEEVAVRVLGRLPLGPDALVAADLLRRLDHPHLVRVLEVSAGSDEAPPFLTMPFVPGPTLRERIATKSIADEERTAWARQILTAVRHLQDAGILHGRIRPSSFLFRGDRIVLANLGLPLVDPEAEPEAAYVAPELLRGEPVSTGSDGFSAAAVLHELLTDEAPNGHPGHAIDGRAGKVLRKLGGRDPLQRLSARAALSQWFESTAGPAPVPGGWPTCAEPVADLLRAAWDLAVAGGHGFLGIEHLVLALRRDARDPGVRRMWMLLGDTELAMRTALAGLSPVSPPAEPRASERLARWRDALADGFDSEALEQVLRSDRGHMLHELASAGPMLAPRQGDASGSTLGLGDLLGADEPCELVVVGGPEDGRVLASPDTVGWIGRHDGTDAIELPLYRDTPCTDLRLSRRHLRWDAGLVELRRPAKAISTLGDARLQPAVHRLPAGTLIELTPSTRLRLQPV